MWIGFCWVLILFARSSNGIYNGVEAKFDFWTFIASVWVNGYQECGGTVIDTRIILTAAQCVKNKPVKKITVRVGTPDIYRGGNVIKVTAMAVHENYKEWNNDIALLWLEKPVLSERVTNIPLPFKEPSENEYPSNAGWGEKLLESYVSPRKLQNGVTKIRPRSLCVDELVEPIGNELLCTFYAENDICPGDYGGPLILANKVVGIAVQGHGCGYAILPSLYTNVFHYLTWIEENSRELKKNN
ncbi:hypodermin-B [Drosophila yakuba]|uniref:trypsin n=1 Tax=Drosophila yakuba TaxID=7245 RepID=B4NW85_DROYA|nr:hypodermin-B [Drosophila yakuba]EDW87365.1 uncharacterized protein Dyak_GE18095 [Drosophila yakuba]